MPVELHVQLIGRLILRDGSGRDCTPRGVKARGLIGLLALTPDRKRSRRWLEGRLWSDRAPEQASGSLRQTLVEIRAALGSAAEALEADREHIGLCGLSTDLESDPIAAREALASGRELLEGIELRDPAFVDWLADQRTRAAGSIPIVLNIEEVPEGLPLLIKLGSESSGYGGFLPLALAEAIGRLVSDFAHVDVFGPNAAVIRIGPHDRGMMMMVEASESDKELHLMLTLSTLRTGQSLWHRHAVLPLEKANVVAAGEFPSIVFEAAEVSLAALPKVVGNEISPLQAEVMISRAVREMFSYDTARMRNADRLLQEALALSPSPRANAWRGFLRQTMLVERTETDPARIMDEADLYSRRALEGTTTNSLVLALVSQVQVMVQGNPLGGAALARDAVAFGPNNAFSHAAKAGSLLRQGRPQESLAAGQYAISLASRSAFLPFLEGLAGLAAIAAGDTESAVSHFEAARARAPQSRAPLRHLLFLYLKTGHTSKALKILADLRRVEPDFSFSRIQEDPAYPAGTLRAAGLVNLSITE